MSRNSGHYVLEWGRKGEEDEKRLMSRTKLQALLKRIAIYKRREREWNRYIPPKGAYNAYMRSAELWYSNSQNEAREGQSRGRGSFREPNNKRQQG